jgi:hypothetical protein
VSPRVSPTERLRAEIDEVFASAADLSDAVELVARLGARQLQRRARTRRSRRLNRPGLRCGGGGVLPNGPPHRLPGCVPGVSGTGGRTPARR